jgi:hypothetical protein
MHSKSAGTRLSAKQLRWSSAAADILEMIDVADFSRSIDVVPEGFHRRYVIE